MKKISTLTAAFFLAHLSYAQITNPAPYCAGKYDDGATMVPHYISNVTLGTLVNNSGTTQYAAPHYVYYNNVAAPKLIAGNSYSLSVAHDPGSLHFVAVYIDFNHNNSFSDLGERVLQQTTRTRSITNPSVATIIIPATAVPGTTRMRVMVFEDDTYLYPDATSCTADGSGNLDWGETEDYNLNITLPTGITEIGKNNANLFYPNPANGYIYADQSLIGNEMTIYSVEGKLVQYCRVTNKIDVSNIKPGQYILKVISNDSVYMQRLFIH